VRRGVAAGFVAALVLTSVLMATGAQAAPATGQFSTKCSYVGILKFEPGLNQGENDFTFIKLDFKLKHCANAAVRSGKGPGGADGTVNCQSGEVTGEVGAKLVINWVTGGRTDLNFGFEFGENNIHGEVVYGLFKGDDVESTNFSMEPRKGDCAETPLVRSVITGTISL